MTVPQEERLARAALTRLCEPDDPDLFEAVRDHGVVDLWAMLRRRDPRLPDRLRAATRGRLGTCYPDKDIEHQQRLGGRLLCPGDDEWPVAVGDLQPLRAARIRGDRLVGGEPIGLWVRGPAALGTVTERSVAIVGSRASTDYGAGVATRWAAELGERGWTVVSGGAYGIDAAAHRGALTAGVPTVCVLASGVDVLYPPDNRALLGRIAETGLLVSEGPPGSTPYRSRFLTRNRLIAAMSCGTVLVEAALRSGARNTLKYARLLGRPRLVVPGPVTSYSSAGCLIELREDEEVRAVACVAHVLEEVGRIGADLAPRDAGPVVDRDTLAPDVRRLLDAVPARRYAPADQIIAMSGLPVGSVLTALHVLQAEGWVEGRDGEFRLASRGLNS